MSPRLLQVDHARVRWNTEDITQNRPALSRWHPDYAEAFTEFVESEIKTEK